MMNPSHFTAASAEEAVAQIRAKLGPEAVVLNVRPPAAQRTGPILAEADD